jgi:hypothetical protein
MSRKIKMVESRLGALLREEPPVNAKTHDGDHHLDRVVPETFGWINELSMSRDTIDL